MIQVSSILKQFKYIDYEMTIDNLVDIVDWSEISCVAVLDSNKKLFGLITEQDIVNAIKNDINIKATQAWELCTHKIQSIPSNASLDEAVDVMVKKHIHHMVINEGDKMVGLISALDILTKLHDDKLIVN